MTMWADNVKFVKDIVDSKYAKIETAAADVRMQSNANSDGISNINIWQRTWLNLTTNQIAEASEALAKDASCHKTKEHFRWPTKSHKIAFHKEKGTKTNWQHHIFSSAVRVLELIQTTEIETLLDTILSVSKS